MKTAKIALIAIGIFLLSQRFIGQLVEDYLNGVGVSFKGFKPLWTILNPANIGLEFSLDMRNDNSFGVFVKGFDGNLMYGGTDLGYFNTPIGITLGANQVNPVKLTLNVNIIQFPLAIQEIIQQKQFLGPLTIKGYIRTNFVDIPITQTVSAIGINGFMPQMGRLPHYYA